MASTVEQIKARLSIVEVAGSYLKLEKAGGNFRAQCPFHNEKTPSFFVSPSRQSYHCFGCNQGGDIFTFVQEMEGVDFLGSLKILAERAGVEISYQSQPDKNKFERLYTCLEAATKIYEAGLAKDSAVQKYLLDRGVSTESIKKFRLGFVADSWRFLHDELIQQKFTLNELLTTGLVVEGERNSGTKGKVYYDRFRGRIMFPLVDPAGRVIGFSGRIFGNNNQVVAKYLNSPQTELFDKSRFLFGYDKAKIAIRRADQVVLVEGQLDLVLSHQAGVENTVAGSGTALTIEQLTLLSRLTKNLVMAYDYDLAGLKASRRAINLAQASGFSIKIAKLPSGSDPADLIKQDPTKWQQAITRAKHHIDFLLDALVEEGYQGLDLNRAINQDVLPAVKQLAKKMEQAHFITKISAILNIEETAIWSDLNNLTDSDELTETISTTPTLAPVLPSRGKLILDRLFGLIFWLNSQTEINLKAVDPETKLKEILGPETYQVESEVRIKDREKLIMETEHFYLGAEALDQTIIELLDNLRLEHLRQALKEALAELRQAELAKDPSRLEQCLKKCQAITQELNILKK
ncbi:MAG: DNA primase [Candidatus Vogelbacteria bacterium CG22_combo_CG10-13_8_21_14_all_37_9]|uniref:DNA primase n=1 Tax=Candidatus Vogelbacteria bacterium CG22_combo_CG10-13_8_21_14_all_37_9 TaxID=1975046 RepID=A0A2H0BL83_9BACT|nr:MAG: DNA primase [Candidatus Vogelbacteria bacterium CG22_combo_CG10-13_8_21_14_all_37_9]